MSSKVYHTPTINMNIVHFNYTRAVWMSVLCAFSVFAMCLSMYIDYSDTACDTLNSYITYDDSSCNGIDYLGLFIAMAIAIPIDIIVYIVLMYVTCKRTSYLMVNGKKIRIENDFADSIEAALYPEEV